MAFQRLASTTPHSSLSPIPRCSAPPSLKKPGLHPILQLQGAIGNKAVLRLIQAQLDADRAPELEPKLTVGAAHDPHEQEADRVAAEVMSVPAADARTTSRTRVVQSQLLGEGVD